MDILLSPPLAFLIYILLVALLSLLGKSMAGPQSEPSSEMKTSLYGAGESAPSSAATPGYKPFFVIAFFFAVLHLGMLVLGSGVMTPITAIFLVGLLLALTALILG